MNAVLEAEPQLATGGTRPPNPPTIDTLPSTGPQDWTDGFDEIDIAEMRAIADQVIREYLIDADPGEAIIAVRIPYDEFHSLFHSLHVLSLDGYPEFDVIGAAMADMYFFDSQITATPEGGAAAAYFNVEDSDDD